MKNIKRKRIPPSTNNLFPIMILIATFFMSIGYASINSIIMNINGEVAVKKQDGIYITEVNYISNVNANLDESKIISAYQTNLNSFISLSNTDKNSSITYEITIYNSNEIDYYFDKVDYLIGNDTYDNSGIIFKLNGLKNNQKIVSKNYVTFNITFSYADSVLSSSNILNSLLNFKFRNFACPVDGRVCDLSGNGNHGVLNGATLNKTESTVYTDGVDDYINCGLANYDVKNTISYVIRFKINSFSTQNTMWEFFGNWQEAGGGLRISDQKNLGISLNINGVYITLTSNKIINLNKWYVAILTYDGNTINIYLDGEKVASTQSKGTTKVSAVPFYIGGNPEKDGSTNYETNMTIDYALLFDRAITEYEATNDYLDMAIISNYQNLLLYYEFE